MIVYTCPCCSAMGTDGPPHGSGVPCPTAIEEKRATVLLIQAQTEDVRSVIRERDRLAA